MRDFGSAGVDRFVTLGSPHNPPPKDIPGVIDQTRGILNWVQENCPGAFQSNVGAALPPTSFLVLPRASTSQIILDVLNVTWKHLVAFAGL